jgi:hypothetical protein
MPEVGTYRAAAGALRQNGEIGFGVIDPAGEDAGEEDKTLRCAHKPKRLIEHVAEVRPHMIDRHDHQ